MAKDNRIWLHVPLSDEATAVMRGARYDEQKEKFFAPNQMVAKATEEWRKPT